jgi:hypothetical protein
LTTADYEVPIVDAGFDEDDDDTKEEEWKDLTTPDIDAPIVNA